MKMYTGYGMYKPDEMKKFYNNYYSAYRVTKQDAYIDEANGGRERQERKEAEDTVRN